MNAFRLTAVASALAIMSACGGGGGDGGDGGGGGNGGSTAKASGTAVKGVIGNGSVEALEIVGGALVSRGTATTNSEGGYDLDISGYTNGPLIIQVAGGTGATTKCDVRAGCNGTAFGNTLPLSSGFVMRTLLPKVQPGAALARCITPFTDLAARRAQEMAGGQLANVTAAQATAALSEVSQLVGGIDVQRTCAVDLTDPDEVDDADSAALALSGLAAAVLAASSDTSNPSTALADLAARFAGGDISAADLQELLDAAIDELEGASPGEKSIAYVAMQDDIDDAAGGTINPEPSSGADQPQVEQGKALVDEVRSLALNLAADAQDADDPGNATVGAFREQLRVARTTVEDSQIGHAFANVFEGAASFYETVAPGTGVVSTTVQTLDSSGGLQSATVTVNRPAAGNASVTIIGRSGDFIVDLSANAPQDLEAGGTTPKDFAGTFTGQMRSASGVGLKATLQGNATATGLTFDAPTERYDAAAASFRGTATFEQIGVSDPFRFAGSLEFDVVDCTTCAASVVLEGGVVDDSQTPIVDLFELNGTFSNSKGEFEAAVALDMDNLTFDRRLPISADNVPSGKVSLQLDAQLDGFHDYSLALVLDLKDITTFAGGTNGDIYAGDANLQASFRRDGKTITVEVEADEPTATSSVVDVRITNQDGVRFEFNNLATDGEDLLTGTVFVGETQVGTVTQTSRGVLIRWNDGTFESLG